MVVREGYKQTEVGVIPEDWTVEKTGNLLMSNPDYGLNAPASEYDANFPTYLRITDISDDGNYNSTKKASVKHFLSHNYHLNNNELVLARTGASVGKSYLYNSNDGILVFAGFLIRLKPNIDLCSPKYLKYYLQSSFYWKWVAVNSMRSGQPGINSNEYSNLPVSLPPKPEQKAIAKALSDVDALIESLEQLIAKKRNIKQGAMQELLTGKRRLPGFEVKKGYKQTEIGEIPEDWIDTTFENVLDGFSSGMTPYRGNPVYYTGNIRWITSGELNYNIIYDTIEKITDEAVKKTSLKILPIGTFLMAITGLEAAGTRGSCGIVGVEATTNQSCMAIYPTEKLSIEYLYQFYVKFGDYLAFNYCQGTKQQSYTAKIVKKLPIILPPTIVEQEAIVSVLFDMDTEIEALETKLEKTKQLKEGMMNELLTGRIRLI